MEDVILYIENPKKPTKRLLELTCLTLDVLFQTSCYVKKNKTIILKSLCVEFSLICSSTIPRSYNIVEHFFPDVYFIFIVLCL